MLGPVSSHAAAETRQVVASLESQPTVAGHSGDHPPDLETLRATPARLHQILIQGNLCAVVERDGFVAAFELRGEDSHWCIAVGGLWALSALCFRFANCRVCIIQ